MTDLTVVPDVGDEALVPAEEALSAEVTPEQVDQVYAVLEQQNASLLQRLAILGKGINPLMLLKLEHDVLLDFVMGDENARRQYDTAVGMQLNGLLKTVLAETIGAQVDG